MSYKKNGSLMKSRSSVARSATVARGILSLKTHKDGVKLASHILLGLLFPLVGLLDITFKEETKDIDQSSSQST